MTESLADYEARLKAERRKETRGGCLAFLVVCVIVFGAIAAIVTPMVLVHRHQVDRFRDHCVAVGGARLVDQGRWSVSCISPDGRILETRDL